MIKYWFDSEGLFPRPRTKEARYVYVAYIVSNVLAILIALFLVKNILIVFLLISNVFLISTFGFILAVRAKSPQHPTELVIGRSKNEDDKPDEVIKL